MSDVEVGRRLLERLVVVANEQTKRVVAENAALRAELAEQQAWARDQIAMCGEREVELEAEAAALRAALGEHTCIEKPEHGFTKERYPDHSCWKLARPAPPQETPPAKTCDQETWVDPAAPRHDRCEHGWPPCCPTQPPEAK